MNKKLLSTVGILIIVILIIIAISSKKPDAPESSATDYRNISYEIDGEIIKLAQGKAETEAAPGSVSKISTELYSGNEARADLNNDGTEDIVFLLFQDGGGTGTFYYVAAALSSGGTYKGTNAILLGDRIAPQTTEIRDGKIIINYADRKPDEPFSEQPSVGTSKYLKVEGQKLVEVK